MLDLEKVLQSICSKNLIVEVVTLWFQRRTDFAVVSQLGERDNLVAQVIWLLAMLFMPMFSCLKLNDEGHTVEKKVIDQDFL